MGVQCSGGNLKGFGTPPLIGRVFKLSIHTPAFLQHVFASVYDVCIHIYYKAF